MITYKRYFNPEFFSEVPVRNDLSEELSGRFHFFADSIRTGLCTVFDKAGITEGDTVFIPAFSPHGLVLPAKKRKITIEYYKLLKDLTPDIEDLDKRITAANNPKALFIIQYFGYLRDLSQIKKLAMKHGLILFEDRAHTSPCPLQVQAQPVLADMEFYSLPKIFPLPEGALFIVNNSKLDCREMILNRNFLSSLAALFNRLQLYFRTNAYASKNKIISSLFSFLSLSSHSLYYFLICVPSRASRLSGGTIRIIERFRFREASERRRYLAGKIISSISNPAAKMMVKINPQSVITGIPFVSNQKDNMISKLKNAGIMVLRYNKYWWHISSRKTAEFVNERYFHDNHFLVPVNENMTEAEADLVAEYINNIIGNEHSG